MTQPQKRKSLASAGALGEEEAKMAEAYWILKKEENRMERVVKDDEARVSASRLKVAKLQQALASATEDLQAAVLRRDQVLQKIEEILVRKKAMEDQNAQLSTEYEGSPDMARTERKSRRTSSKGRTSLLSSGSSERRKSKHDTSSIDGADTADELAGES